jgi:hypothetical protein
MTYPGSDRIEMPADELKSKAISILLSSKYESINGIECANSVLNPVKKEKSPNWKPRGPKIKHV